MLRLNSGLGGLRYARYQLASRIPRIWASSASPQSTKVRKILRRQVLDHPDKTLLCTSASKSEQYDLKIAFNELLRVGHTPSLDDAGGVVHCRIGGSDVFVLSSGAVVGWDMDESMVREAVLPVVEPAEINSFSDIETEDMDYVEEQTGDDVQSGMIGDVIYIHGASRGSRLRDKVAFSSGLARHTKLSAIEMRAEDLIKQVKVISRDLAAGRETRLNNRDVLQLTGRVLQLRGVLNLYSEVTETPDFYWSEPELERLYELISRKLDVSERIEILNKKLDYVSDMVGVLRGHLSEKTGRRLEWMVILLISVEVVFELWHLSRPVPPAHAVEPTLVTTPVRSEEAKA